MGRKEHKDIREIFKGMYNCIIKNVKYPRQIFEGKVNNVLFEECNFDNITFMNVQFKNVIFNKCKFSGCNFIDSKVSYMNKLAFINCSITFSNWTNCQFVEMSCFNTVINIANFVDTNLFNSCIYATTFKQVTFQDNCNLEGVSIIRPIGWFDINLNNNNGLVKLNRKTNISRFDYEAKATFTEQIPLFADYIINNSIAGLKQYNSDAVGETFLNIANQFKRNNLEEEYGIYYYIGKTEIHKKLPPWKKIKSFLGLITCGYGEKWYYGVYTSIVIILCTSVFYMSGLELSNGQVIKYGLDFNNWSLSQEKLFDYGYCLYYSIMTFMTVNDGSIKAIGVLSYTLSFIEVVLGGILITIITGSILRKLFR